MKDEAVVVTGANGGIGGAICRRLISAEYAVIGIDREAACHSDVTAWVHADLETLAADAQYGALLLSKIESCLREQGSRRLCGLVNNAATQLVLPAEELSVAEFKRALDVNVVAPFALARQLFAHLSEQRGCVINIGSIHSRLTKPGFCAYSTSKAALAGLTRALAVEWGNKIRIASIEPAAISTSMLESGFENNPAARAALAVAHPAGIIGDADHVAAWVLHLLADHHPFANGTVVNIDGGISFRLHDPI